MQVENVNFDAELKNMSEGVGEAIKPWRNRMKAVETGLIDESVLSVPIGEKISYIEIGDVRLKNRRDVENLMAFLENCKLGIEKGAQKFERVKDNYLSEGADMEMESPMAYKKSHYSDSINETARSTNDV